MSIIARNITKRFGAKLALDHVTVEAPGGSCWRCWGLRVREDDAAADHRGAGVCRRGAGAF